ncbi:MAG: thioredoxin domain-containing protein [Fimbriimonadaceae bacterium]|nr:thioredoxin domain-containing protein [Fimbriimonadaceae bacterium]QYK55647.1 MAG: thioredoxin domain-containing protein [Fimbriimonadaceae bacterium]
MNRLAQSPSLYLRQHGENPVDWYPWGEEAWERARQENRPVFLSAGYSSCHWCHVMAHESFEDAEVAAALNQDFVCIKLDREEHPQVDEAYMTAVQMATGHGGWPMSVFLTPDGDPFFAGTYFPRDGRRGTPGFLTIVQSLGRAWRDQHQDVVSSATEFGKALREGLARDLPAEGQIGLDHVDHVVEALHAEFDPDQGGFGDKPKFPPHAALRFLLRYAELRPALPGEAPSELAREMAVSTLEALCQGGIHDHVGGGFHRYSTDEAWRLPHFEKMLYDNGQLMGALGAAPRDLLLDQAVDRCVAWLKREMSSPSGWLYSAIDADSDGGEGSFYVWRIDEAQAVLGTDSDFPDRYQMAAEGNFADEATGERDGTNVLHLARGKAPACSAELDSLLAARGLRPHPATDDKAIAAWNALAVTGLVAVGRRAEAEAVATKWAAFGTELPHMVVQDSPYGEGLLDDFAFMANAYLDLSLAPGDLWWERAEAIIDHIVVHFASPGGFRYARGNGLFSLSRPFVDNATPSPNGLAARILRRLGRNDEAWETLQAGAGWLERLPQACPSMALEVLELLAAGVAAPPRIARPRPVATLSLDPSVIAITPEGWGHAIVMLAVPDGFHIDMSRGGGISLELTGAYGEASLPSEGEQLQGTVEIPLRIQPRGGGADFRIKVFYSLCTQSECLPPQSAEVSGVLSRP